jgi:hypothetical protein
VPAALRPAAAAPPPARPPGRRRGRGSARPDFLDYQVRRRLSVVARGEGCPSDLVHGAWVCVRVRGAGARMVCH